MNITVSAVRREISELEQKLAFQRQLLAYLVGDEQETTNKPVMGKQMGIKAAILRALAKSAATPDNLAALGKPEQRHAFMNMIGSLRRENLLRDTAKGKVELTTEGFKEAQWYLDHPLLIRKPNNLQQKTNKAGD